VKIVIVPLSKHGSKRFVVVKTDGAAVMLRPSSRVCISGYPLSGFIR